jgi:hypothetical protein
MKLIKRMHDDKRGFSVSAPHPEGKDWTITLLSVRWGKTGRGIHLYWDWIKKVIVNELTDEVPVPPPSPSPPPSHWAEDDEPIHLWFDLTYSNYLCLPRSVLQSMPHTWQVQLCDLLDQMEDSFGYLDWPRYRVSAIDRSTGRFMKDPIPHYNRGRTRLEPR